MSRKFEEIVSWLQSRPERPGDMQSKRESVARLAAVLQEEGLLRKVDRHKVIVVAGTNGKGTVAKTISTLLGRQGLRTGLFTSPHLMQITERIAVNDSPITREQFVALFERHANTCEEKRLSFFESLSLMMVEAFWGGQILPAVDWAVLEVGVGGRWDPTNLIPHHTAVITALGLDHQNLLGDSLPEIAEHKLGVCSGGLTVHRRWPTDEVQALADQVAHTRGGQWLPCETWPFRVAKAETRPTYWLQTPFGEAPLSLMGARAVENTTLALRTLGALGFDVAKMLPDLARVQWPGRMEGFRVPGCAAPVYLSGDHNEMGVQSLEEILQQMSFSNLHVVASVGGNKDLSGILSALWRLPRAQINLTVNPFRGRPLTAYGEWLERAADSSTQWQEVFHRVLQRALAGDLVLVTGSLYLVGVVRATLMQTGAELIGAQERD